MSKEIIFRHRGLHACAAFFSACMLLCFTLSARCSDLPASPENGSQGSKLKIALVGDSTMADFKQESPCRGWGSYLHEKLDATHYEVVNEARAGRSSKTFLTEGLWSKVLLQKPDYVLIQFGHNDSHAADKPESTDPRTVFPENLRRYVDEARAAKCEPILLTPVCRRSFTPDGHIDNTLEPYVEAVKAVAAEKKVPLIDLNAMSLVMCEKMGPQECLKISSTPKDVTHFNEAGARKVMELVYPPLFEFLSVSQKRKPIHP
jgi:lysophospholipase L1-like esterase